MLYSTQGENAYPTTSSDYYNITTTSASASLKNQHNFTNEINILLPSGMKSFLSQDAGTVVTLC